MKKLTLAAVFAAFALPVAAQTTTPPSTAKVEPQAATKTAQVTPAKSTEKAGKTAAKSTKTHAKSTHKTHHHSGKKKPASESAAAKS